MISLVICSQLSDVSSEIKQNIINTIGVDYELIVINNSKNQYSIFSAYNEGVRRSKGDIVCFMHEDVLFRDVNWGRTVENHFGKYDNLGVLGVAGTHFLSSYPMYWTESPFISEHNITVVQGNIIECIKNDFFDKDGLAEVVACDGMCFFVSKKIFEEIIFDEETYSGFHLYDMDICMQVIDRGYHVCVCNDILVEHNDRLKQSVKGHSGSNGFYSNLLLFSKKWQSSLPMVRGLDFIQPYMIQRLNNMVGYKHDALRARQSKSYRIGSFILRPWRILYTLLNNK